MIKCSLLTSSPRQDFFFFTMLFVSSCVFYVSKNEEQVTIVAVNSELLTPYNTE